MMREYFDDILLPDNAVTLAVIKDALIYSMLNLINAK